MDDQMVFSGLDAGERVDPVAGVHDAQPDDRPRLRRVDRHQVRMIACSLDELLADDHPARLLWEAVGQLDLSDFEQAIRARGSEPGRAATDPRILITLWLYAATRGIGGGREVARLCEVHDAYRWIAGGVTLNYHTINDFRVDHESALDALFTQLLAVLLKQGLIEVQRVSQDATRVRAGAGSSSFRTEATLQELEAEAHTHIETLKQQNDPTWSAQQTAKRKADAKDRLDRVTQAIEQLSQVRDIQANNASRKARQGREPRASTTDPEARVMKMGDGGYRPAYNVQLAADTESRAILGMTLSNHASDAGQDTPMREQIKQRTGRSVREHLYDGGYVTLKSIDQAEANGVAVYAPVPQNRKSKEPFARKRDDTDHSFAWRQRMNTDAAKTIYKLRASTSETIHGDLREHRGLHQFHVRGSPKVKCVMLWMILAYNLMLFLDDLTNPGVEKS